MSADNNYTEEELFGKGVIFVASLAIAVISFPILKGFGLGTGLSIFTAIVLALINPVLAGVMAKLCEMFNQLGFPATYQPWSGVKKIWMGAFWPLTVVYWVVVGIVFAIIHQAFKKEGK